MMVYRGGPGSPSAAEVRVEKSGTIKLITGLMDVGEGATTVLPQIAAEVLGAEFEQIEPVFGDTTGTPDAPITAGSTATFSTGTAVVQAAEEVRQRLLELASSGLEAPVRELDAALGYVFVKSDPSRRMSLTQVAGSMEGEANRTVREARIALGGVAPVPYRAMDAEAFFRISRLGTGVAGPG